MRHTKYHHLSTDELLSQVESARPHSDVIEELCLRLETNDTPAGTELECPVCEAKLRITDDEDGPELETV
jgi:hypothetical protein